MSRDVVSRAGAGALPVAAAVAEPDDLGAPPVGADADGLVRSSPTAHPLVALLVVAGLGAACAGLADRSGDPGGPAADDAAGTGIVVVEARPDPDADPRADALSVRLALAGRGSTDATVLGGGSGAPGRRVAGRVALTGSSWLAHRADDPVVVGAGEVTTVVVTVDVGCEPAPVFEPWMRVRPPSGAVELVELDAVDGAGSPGVLEAACAARDEERDRLAPPPAGAAPPTAPAPGGRSAPRGHLLVP